MCLCVTFVIAPICEQYWQTMAGKYVCKQQRIINGTGSRIPGMIYRMQTHLSIVFKWSQFDGLDLLALKIDNKLFNWFLLLPFIIQNSDIHIHASICNSRQWQPPGPLHTGRSCLPPSSSSFRTWHRVSSVDLFYMVWLESCAACIVIITFVKWV